MDRIQLQRHLLQYLETIYLVSLETAPDTDLDTWVAATQAHLTSLGSLLDALSRATPVYEEE